MGRPSRSVGVQLFPFLIVIFISSTVLAWMLDLGQSICGSGRTRCTYLSHVHFCFYQIELCDLASANCT